MSSWPTITANFWAFAFLMAVGALATVSEAEASMDIPCLTITKSQADAILLKEARIRAAGTGGYVTEDGYSLATAGLDQYCTINNDGLRTVSISGAEHGYYSMTVFTLRDDAATAEFLTRLNDAMKRMAFNSQHTSRLSPVSVLNIVRVGR